MPPDWWGHHTLYCIVVGIDRLYLRPEQRAWHNTVTLSHCQAGLSPPRMTGHPMSQENYNIIRVWLQCKPGSGSHSHRGIFQWNILVTSSGGHCNRYSRCQHHILSTSGKRETLAWFLSHIVSSLSRAVGIKKQPGYRNHMWEQCSVSLSHMLGLTHLITIMGETLQHWCLCLSLQHCCPLPPHFQPFPQ